MLNRSTRTARRSAEAKNQQAALRLETLESREVPAVLIQIDYSFDNGFFTNNPAARAVMEQVAGEIGNELSANLSAIAPGGANSWTASFFNPSTGGQVALPNLTIGANTIKVFVGSRVMGGSEAGYGGTGGYSISGTQDWLNTIQNRGNGGFSAWGGSIAFDTSQNWYFGSSASGLAGNQLDFYSVASHELGHVLGIGTSQQWSNLSSGGHFVGGNAESVYGGAVPLSADGDHWADGITVNGQAVSLDPTLMYGQRVSFSSLDYAALHDLGWGAAGPGIVPANTATAGHPQAVAFAGSTSGTVSTYTAGSGGLTPTGATFVPFAGYTGEVRVAAGDFNGDGTVDYAFSTGAGVQSVVEVLNGRDGSYLVAPTVLLPGYNGGFSIAAGDVNGDGKAELIVAVSNGAPPIVAVFGANGGLQLETAFVAFDAAWFSGGLRVAAGDINGDGYADVVVTTASQVGAVGIYNGKDLSQGQANYLFAPFIPLPGTTYGLNAAVGDMDGDGYGDLALTFEQGPGIVAVWSGALMTANPNTPVNQLPFIGGVFAFNDLAGARLAMEDLDGDGRADLIVTSANKLNPQVRLYSIGSVTAGGAGGASAYPVGTSSVNGVYAADHAQPSNQVAYLPPVDEDHPYVSAIPVA